MLSWAGAAIFIMAFSLLAERVWKSKFAPSQREDLDEQAAAIIREVEASMDVGLHQLQLLGTAIQVGHTQCFTHTVLNCDWQADTVDPAAGLPQQHLCYQYGGRCRVENCIWEDRYS